jgi:REase_DpnII-MboI
MERKEQLRLLLSKTNALLEAMRYSVDSANSNDVWKYGSYKVFLTKYNDLAKEATPLLSVGIQIYGVDLSKVPGSEDTIAPQQKNYFDQAHSNMLLLKSLLEGEIGYAEDETHRLTIFMQGSLRKAVHGTPTREVDIQNAIETLLVGRGMEKGLNYDRETGRVKTSGKECVPDFVFADLKLCLEVKLVTTTERLKTTVDELNADIRMYGKRYDRQLYVVYDLGMIRDETEFKHDLEKAPGVTVLIVKH